MSRLKFSSQFIFLVCALALTSSAYAQDAIHAVVGAVTKVDKTTKTLAIKTADGSEQVFKYTERTAIRDSRATSKAAKMGALDTYFAGRDGARVVVRYMGKGADQTATVVEDFGKDTLKGGKATVTKVDRAARTVSVRTEDGAEHTFQLGSQAIVETDHGVVRGSRYAFKEGDKVIVHYTESEGGKVVHFFKKL